MADERKGFLTPEEEEKLHKLLKLKGFIGVIDKPLLTLLDNIGLEKLKPLLGANADDILKTLYLVIDTVFDAVPDPV